MKKHYTAMKLLPVYLITPAIILLLAWLAGKSTDVIVQNTPTADRNCIVIDAGHGGMDGGATSCTGILESNINLEIALRLNDLLRLLGTDTYMIRSTDTSVDTGGDTIAQRKVSDLKQRVRIVNSKANCLLLSIHQNYFDQSRYYGPQVFYAETADSKALSERLQDVLNRQLCPGCHRKCKAATGIYLMEHISCPGILVECGFLSNPEEEAKLRSSAYQKELVCVLSSECLQYLDKNTVS